MTNENSVNYFPSKESGLVGQGIPSEESGLVGLGVVIRIIRFSESLGLGTRTFYKVPCDVQVEIDKKYSD